MLVQPVAAQSVGPEREQGPLRQVQMMLRARRVPSVQRLVESRQRAQAHLAVVRSGEPVQVTVLQQQRELPVSQQSSKQALRVSQQVRP